MKVNYGKNVTVSLGKCYVKMLCSLVLTPLILKYINDRQMDLGLYVCLCPLNSLALFHNYAHACIFTFNFIVNLLLLSSHLKIT